MRNLSKVAEKYLIQVLDCKPTEVESEYTYILLAFCYLNGERLRHIVEDALKIEEDKRTVTKDSDIKERSRMSLVGCLDECIEEARKLTNNENVQPRLEKDRSGLKFWQSEGNNKKRSNSHSAGESEQTEEQQKLLQESICRVDIDMKIALARHFDFLIRKSNAFAIRDNVLSGLETEYEKMKKNKEKEVKPKSGRNRKTKKKVPPKPAVPKGRKTENKSGKSGELGKPGKLKSREASKARKPAFR